MSTKRRGWSRLVAGLALLLAGCRGGEDSGPEVVRQESASKPAGYFTDVAEDLGLEFHHHGGLEGSYYVPQSIGSGCAFADFDGDARLDAYLVDGGPDGRSDLASERAGNRLFRQQSDGTFHDVTRTAGLSGSDYGMGVATGDYDNDGDVDIYVSNVGPDILYRNDGGGGFSDVTSAAGIEAPLWGSSATFFDYDRDGDLDLYVTHYLALVPDERCVDHAGRPDYCGPAASHGLPDQLYRNDGDGTFTDVSETSGIAQLAGNGLGVVALDLDGDDWPDLLVANDRMPNHFWVNQRDGSFREEALIAGVAVDGMGGAGAGMGIAVGDPDHDGDADLYITHMAQEYNTFYRNLGELGFQDDSFAVRLAGPDLPLTGYGVGFLDFDHDGDLDLAVANGRMIRGPLLPGMDVERHWDHYSERSLLFENDGQGGFKDVTSASGDFGAALATGRGLALGDYDDDGDVDLLVSRAGGLAALFRNDVPKRGHWLQLRLLDQPGARDALGARVSVRTGDVVRTRWVLTGSGILSAHDPRVHFGLGAVNLFDEVRVAWPDGRSETFAGGEADRSLTLRQGTGEPTV